MRPFRSITRRELLGAAATAGAGALLPSRAWSQGAFPNRPIRLVVPFTPGGVTDTSGRVIADFLGKRLGQNIVVDNKPGASGNIGTHLVASAEPDGYTLLLAFDGTMVINPHVFDKVPFDTAKDFAPVGKIGDAVLILVANPGLAAKNWRDLVQLSRGRQGGLSYGTSGTGSTPHIAGELLKQKTGVSLVHVPYKGGGQAMTDVMGGSIPLVYTAVAGAYQYIRAGKLHPIAVSSAQRVPSLPDVPTFIESGVADFEVNSWVGVLAPGRTPKPVLDRLNEELNAVLQDPAAKSRLADLGITATPGPGDRFMEEMKRDLERYGQVVKAANVKAS